LESRVSVLNVVGLKWILEAGKCEKGKLYEEIEECKQLLVTNGCNPRFALSYSLVLVFGRKISSRFFPTFDFQTYIINQIKNEAEVEHNESLATQFFETIEGLQSASDRPKIDGTHMLKEGNELYIWFSHIFRIYSSENKLKEDFSKAAVLHAIKEEPYYLRSDRKGLGVRGVQRRVLVLDIDKAPDSIKNIAEFLG
jgi:hypothetical protein